MSASHTVAVLAGDGIGPEVTEQALRVLDELGGIEVDRLPVGGAAIDADGEPLPDATLAACRTSDAILFGAVGGPRWESLDPAVPRPEQGLLRLRTELGLFANLRGVRAYPALHDRSPLKNERVAGLDLLIVRELTGGLYFGARGTGDGAAYDTCSYQESEIERVVRVAFGLARTKVTSVDKSNVLDTGRMWRAVAHRVHEREFPGTPLEDLLVDNAAMQLVLRPAEFDVLVMENSYGDILSDEAIALTGSIGLGPSASLGSPGVPGLFEPVHGSAPDLVGTGAANPYAMILSASSMLRHGLGRTDEADAVDRAVAGAIDDLVLTPDLGGTSTTATVTDAVLARLR